MSNSDRFSGGTQVKASTLVAGNFIRDPRKMSRILIVEEIGGQIYARGYEQSETNIHRYFDKNTTVTQVFNCSTDTTLDGKA